MGSAHRLLFLIDIRFLHSIYQANHGKQTVSPIRKTLQELLYQLRVIPRWIVSIAILFAQHANHLHDKVEIMLSLSCTIFQLTHLLVLPMFHPLQVSSFFNLCCDYIIYNIDKLLFSHSSTHSEESA